VIADHVAVGQHPPWDRPALPADRDLLTDLKERRRNVLAFEDLKELRSVRPGTIVERQRHCRRSAGPRATNAGPVGTQPTSRGVCTLLKAGFAGNNARQPIRLEARGTQVAGGGALSTCHRSCP
jgi:hypothetical protein